MRILLALLFCLQVGEAWALPKLRWGADVQSGAPFSYKSPEDPGKVIGFEAEIVAALAAELGMEPEFVQNAWAGLIEGLHRNDYDIVINGLEITPDRAREVHFTQPYYYTTELLTVHKENGWVHSLEDLKGRRVGTLDGSVAQRILVKLPYPVESVPYLQEVHAYGDLILGRVDAVLLDEPVAIYYGKPNPELKMLTEPIGRVEYGIAVRKGDREFALKVNSALQKLIENGTIRKILERWNLWNSYTATAWGMSPTPETKAEAYQKYLETAWTKRSFQEKVDKYMSFLPLLGKGALMTLQISIISMCLAMVIGLLVALSRLYGPTPLRWLAVSFTELWRGTPLLIQLYLIFYGLPHIGIRFDPFLAAVIGLGLNYGACESENYRAGILSIPKAQMDASQALGMSWLQSLRHIILPQAIRNVIPPVTNDFIALLKDSSLVSVISMVELTTVYGQLASTYFDYLGIGLLTAGIYFLIGLPFVRLSRYFEHQLTSTALKSQRSNGRRTPTAGALRDLLTRRYL